jgi:nitroreductase
MKYTLSFIAGLVLVALLFSGAESRDARQEIVLAKPALAGGITLMQALANRQSSRSFSAKPIPESVLSGLLWAACGENRTSGKRTAPTAMNKQEIALYVAMAEGLYLYDAKKHALKLVVAEDLRALTGKQPFVKDAFMNIVYVADMSVIAGDNREEKTLYAGADTGFIGENVYLYCAGNGLTTVIRAWMDKEKLGKAMKLSSSQMIVLSQTVGYPAK